MKLNNKGFAISTIMYIILVLAVVLISLALTSLGNRKLILDKLKDEVIDEIYDNSICVAVNKSLTGNVAENDSNGNRIYKLGDEYLCEVKEGVKYTFFVISEEEQNVNFIMSKNINSDGTITLEGILKSENNKYNLVPWISQEDYSELNIDNTVCESNSCVDEGPITVINFLNNATNSWNKLENLNSELVLQDGVTKFKLDGKARLPYQTEINLAGCKNEANTCPLWLVNYLADNPNYTNDDKTIISNIIGYWTLDISSNKTAWTVSSGADLQETDVYVYITHGVRPVISVSKDKIR